MQISPQSYIFFEKNSRNIWLIDRKSIILPTERKENSIYDDKNSKLLVVAQLKIRTIVRR